MTRRVVFMAIPIVALATYLFYTWFAVLDRYFIFLYFHNMGPQFDTGPFGWVTASRYWMAGLVASGVIMVLYAASNAILTRWRKNWQTPDWWRVWIACAIPLLFIIPAIVMTVNDPVLPLANAAQVTMVTCIGLAPALWLGKIAARPLGTLVLLGIDGFAIAGLLISVGKFDSIPGWIAAGRSGTLAVAFTGPIVCLALLALASAPYAIWQRIQVPDTMTLFILGLATAYLFLPLVHHLTSSEDFLYISSSDNFFSRSIPVQIGAWFTAALIALAFTRLRLQMSRQKRGSPGEGVL